MNELIVACRGMPALAAFLALVGVLPSGCVFAPRPRTSYEANSQVLALPQVVVFQSSAGPLSYHTPTGKDVALKVAPRAKGKACQHGIQLPIFWGESAPSLSGGWGKGAFEEAIAAAREGLPPDAVLFDVRADLNQFAILTVYRRQCLLVDAGVAVPVAVVAPAAAPAVPPADSAVVPVPEPAAPADAPVSPAEGAESGTDSNASPR